MHILSCGTPRRHRVVVTYPCSSPKYGPEVRQAINDALFTRLYIDQDVTRVDWNDEAAEIYAAAQQAGDGTRAVATRTKAKRDAEASRLPTLTDVLLASGEATSRRSWNTAVMAEGVGFEPTMTLPP